MKKIRILIKKVIREFNMITHLKDVSMIPNLYKTTIKLILLLLLGILFSNGMAQEDFIYEEGSSPTVAPKKSTKVTVSKPDSTMIKHKSNIKNETPARVKETNVIPKSFYREFIDKVKIGAVIGLILTIAILFIIPNSTGYAFFITFPIIWFICTLVAVFVSGC